MHRILTLAAAAVIVIATIPSDVQAQFCLECVFHEETFCLGCHGCQGGVCGYDCTQPSCDVCQVSDSCSGDAEDVDLLVTTIPSSSASEVPVITDGLSLLVVKDSQQQLEEQAEAIGNTTLSFVAFHIHEENPLLGRVEGRKK